MGTLSTMEPYVATCDVCGQDIVGGGYLMPRGPGGMFAAQCCTRPACLPAWFKGLCQDEEGV